jgi:hypothetical protein
MHWKRSDSAQVDVLCELRDGEARFGEGSAEGSPDDRLVCGEREIVRIGVVDIIEKENGELVGVAGVALIPEPEYEARRFSMPPDATNEGKLYQMRIFVRFDPGKIERDRDKRGARNFVKET